MEEAFRLNVKWSLQELSRAINGDGKSAPNPLLRVKVVLEGDKVTLVHMENGRLFPADNYPLFLVNQIKNPTSNQTLIPTSSSFEDHVTCIRVSECRLKGKGAFQ